MTFICHICVLSGGVAVNGVKFHYWPLYWEFIYVYLHLPKKYSFHIILNNKIPHILYVMKSPGRASLLISDMPKYIADTYFAGQKLLRGIHKFIPESGHGKLSDTHPYLVTITPQQCIYKHCGLSYRLFRSTLLECPEIACKLNNCSEFC